MSKKPKKNGRPTYPQVYIGGMSEQAQLNLVKALAEEEQKHKKTKKATRI